MNQKMTWLPIEWPIKTTFFPEIDRDVSMKVWSVRGCDALKYLQFGKISV